MNQLNQLNIQPVYNRVQENPVEYLVSCNIPRWLDNLYKWSQITILFNGTEEQCKEYLDWYNKVVVPENDLMDKIF